MKREKDLISAKYLQKANQQFFRDFNELITDFELLVQRKMGDIKIPSRVNRQTAAVINSKLSDIKRCFPECPGYAAK